nr:MAG TPA: hypothetical protein [Caudoviricetes sp.]
MIRLYGGAYDYIFAFCKLKLDKLIFSIFYTVTRIYAFLYTVILYFYILR